MNCTHEESRFRRIHVVDDETGDEYIETQQYSHSLTEDLDCGRYQCTRCGKVMYYTGLWRDFYEKGIPCPGSDLVSKYAKEPKKF